MEKPEVKALETGAVSVNPDAALSGIKGNVLREQHTYYEARGDELPQLTEEHSTYLIGITSNPPLTCTPENYLVQRHGTYELDPLPSADPADPYNWPAWKVC
jgi:hypothetical protein